MMGGNQVGALGAWLALLEDLEADSWVVLTDVPWLSSETVLLVVLCIVPAVVKSQIIIKMRGNSLTKLFRRITIKIITKETSPDLKNKQISVKVAA